MIIFIHVPKTAGTTMASIIRQNYPPEHRLRVAYYHAQAPNTKAETILNRHDFEQLSSDQKQPLRIILSDMPFGMHKMLPQGAKARYLTSLRHPVDRIISYYYYIRSRPESEAYQEMTAQNASLEDVTEALDFQNSQTRKLLGIEKIAGKDRPVTLDDIDQVKQNLADYFLFAGVSKRFDESLVLMKQTLGWPNIFYTRRNVTRKRPTVTQIAEETRQKIAAANAIDMQLYDYVSDHFDALVRQQGEPFQHKVRQFQRLNALYNRMRMARQRLGQVKRRVVQLV
ncbi:MAG: sulfotransferase family 2 domain-containing protein [Chloroflexaceae bacterium]|nr:sulfotransferase family 2 domain-containing protein [Chloroflexaceae bacterium]